MSRSGFARLFVAADPPVAVRESLAVWARGVGRGRVALRLVEPEMLHVTLCFLGSRPVDEIDVLGETVARVAAAAAPVSGLSLGAPLWLPSRRPRALAVEVHDPGGELGGLQAMLADALGRAIGWEPERRRFRPHITVARMSEGAAPRERGLAPTPDVRFAAQEVGLYRSWLAREGASYESLMRVGVG